MLSLKKLCQCGIVLFGSGTFLAGCSGLIEKQVEWEVVEPESYPVLSAVGYAPIESQRGNSDNQRSLMAIRASKLDAYRELAPGTEIN